MEASMFRCRHKLVGLIAAGVFAAIVALYLLLTLFNPLEQRLAELQAAGAPVSLVELAKPTLADADNARTYLVQSKADAKAFEQRLAAVPEATLNKSGTELTPTEREQLSDLLAAFPALETWIEQMADAPDFALPIDANMTTEDVIEVTIDDVGPMRILARFLCLKAKVSAASGKGDEALNDSTRALRLAHHCRQAPTLVFWLVGVAIDRLAIETANESLRITDSSATARELLLTELRRLDVLANYTEAIARERAYSIASIRDILDQSPNFPGYRLYVEGGICGVLDVHAEQIDLARQPYAEYVNFMAKPPKAARWFQWSLGSQLAPSFEAMRRAFEENRALRNCLEILLAIDLSSEATTLATVTEVPAPPDATIDPFTDEPLLLRHTPQGPLIYSVGSNRIDDGGSVKDARDIGLAPLPSPPSP
jgi:hypothetical protein